MLDAVLRSDRGAPKRAFADKLRMALGVARGMQALEEAQPPILHRDLKASNVFLDAGMQLPAVSLLFRWLADCGIQLACRMQLASDTMGHGLAGGNPRVADMGLSRRWEPESAASLTGETGGNSSCLAALQS